jgi:hypothetical protein
MAPTRGPTEPHPAANQDHGAHTRREEGRGSDGWSNAGRCRPRLASVSQQLSPGAETIVDERTEFRVEEGDHERFSHFVPKEKLTEAMVMGTPVVALCGKVWVPSRDPQRFPVCPECKEIWEGFSDKEDGSGDE